MKKKLVSMLLTAAMAIGMFAGCSSPADDTEQTPKDELVTDEQKTGDVETTGEEHEEITAYIGTSIFDSSLDPVKGAMSYGYPFINSALLKVNPDSEYVGDLATDWEISPDALTYTFKLREGVKFSDGSDFTAEDVVFTYQTVMDNQANNENVDLTRLESVTAVDEMTVKFKLAEPYSPFFDTVAMLQIVPSDAYDSAAFDQYPIGTGAYKMVQYDTNQQMILGINEYYYGKTPDVEKVTFVYMDADAAFAAAQSGQLDIVMVGTAYANETIDNMTLQKFETMDVRNIHLIVNPEQTVTDKEGNEVVAGNNVTSDKAVREALTIGIDRQAIIDNAFNGIGKVATNFTDNLVWASTDNIQDGRVEEAIQILEDAGWVDTDGDGVREKDGLKCEYTIYALGGDQDRYQLGVAVAEDAAKLGIKIDVKTATWDEAIELQRTNGIIWGWGQFSPTVLSSMYYSDYYLDGGWNNVCGIQSEEVDAKIEEALGANTQEDAIKAWKEVQALVDAQYTNLYIVNIEHGYFVNDSVDLSMDTQVPHPHGHGGPIICNMVDWTIE